jgi:hypothetical protein
LTSTSKDKMDNSPLELRFAGIQLISKKLEAPSKERVITDIYRYDTKIENRIKPAESLIFTFVFSNIMRGDLQLASFVISCIYEVANFEKTVTLDEKGDLPDKIDNFLKSVSISTARGIIYSELRGTHLHNLIMPLIDLKDLSDEPVEGMNFEE